MFCQKCGNEINDSAVVCPNCGCPTGNESSFASPVSSNVPTIENGEKGTLADCAIIFAIIIPIVGLILGIIGAVKYKTSKLKNRCIIAIPISIVVWIIAAMIMFG